MALAAEQGGIDRVFAHAPNTGAAPASNRFAVSAPAGSESRSQIANNGATGGAIKGKRGETIGRAFDRSISVNICFSNIR